jgi:hypothetical protein
MKIFEKRQFTDGGPNDRGFCIGYIHADTEEEAKRILNIKHGFIQLFEITNEEYEARKEEAAAMLRMFTI